MSRHLALLPGGGGRPGQVRHRREPISHVGQLYPTYPTPDEQAAAVGHPSVYDRELQTPDDPTALGRAVEVLVLSYLAPGRTTLAEHVDAARVLADHFGIAADDCNPHGMPRPGGVA